MNKKILIIEDDTNILSGLQAKLRVEGLEVLINNGTDEISYVINKINTEKPDYIILDLLLPKIDGFELLSAIKAGDHGAKTPVFIFTNLADKDSQEKCNRLGAEHYFIKSDFNFDDFVEKIKKIISNLGKIKD